MITPAFMNRRARFIWCLLAAFSLATAVLFFVPSSGRTRPRLPVKWKPQPDSFPLGTVLRGSSVEINFGFFSDITKPQQPAWINRLPAPLARVAYGVVVKSRSASNKSKWKMEVEAPDFIRIDESKVDYHPDHGCFPTVVAHLATDRPGVYAGQIKIRLTGRGYETKTELVPVSATVIETLARWRVLVADTPFQRYATEDGASYDPLAKVVTRLAGRGVRVDFRSALPQGLEGWNAILLAETSLVDLNDRGMESLHRFVAKGGRLIVAADAFFGGTTSKANVILSRYGMRMGTNDAGWVMLTSKITADPLTRNVSKLSFFRPTKVWVVDPKEARLLAAMEDDETAGFIAASRTAGRGEVVLLAQSLWWNWLRFKEAEPANAVMLENLLSP